MAEYFKKVMVSEELPHKGGYYDTDKGLILFDLKSRVWYKNDIIHFPKYWYSKTEGNILTDEELEKIKTDAFHGGYSHKEEEIQQAIEAKSANSLG